MFAARTVEKSERRAERSAGDEEIGASAHEARDPHSDRDERDGVDDEKNELKIHRSAG